MLFMSLFYTCAAAKLLIDALLFETDHIEYFSKMIASSIAIDVFYFRCFLHFTTLLSKFDYYLPNPH